jgi:hypothetical protein
MTGAHKRRRRATTNTDYAAMLRRMLAAYGRRTETDPAAGLSELRHVEADLRELTTAAADRTSVAAYLASQRGTSYNQIARQLGTTKAAAIKRVRAGEAIAARVTGVTPLAARRAEPRQLPAGHDTASAG